MPILGHSVDNEFGKTIPSSPSYISDRKRSCPTVIVRSVYWSGSDWLISKYMRTLSTFYRKQKTLLFRVVARTFLNTGQKDHQRTVKMTESDYPIRTAGCFTD